MLALTFGDIEENIFVGKNTRDNWHLFPTSRHMFNPPTQKTTYVEIPGVNGALDLSESLTGYPVYNPREGSFEFYVTDDFKPRRTIYNEVLNYLHGKYMKVVSEETPEYYYEGRFQVSELKSEGAWSSFTIIYKVNPYKRAITSSITPWIWDIFNFETGVIVLSEFTHIIISRSTYIDITFPDEYFGNEPICPYLDVTGTITIEYTYQKLNVVTTVTLTDGCYMMPDIIFYGESTYTIKAKGTGLLTIVFTKGEL